MVVATCADAQNDRRGNNRQNNTPPPAVQQRFQKDHPASKGASWQHSSSQQWHARVTDPASNRQYDSYYNKNGKQVDSHQPLERNEVPPNVDTHIRGRYHADDYAATRIERPGHSVIFQVDIRQKNKHRKIYTDDRGREMKYNDRH